MAGPVVLVAPHPDDETLGCGGYLAQCRDAGRRVHVIVLTQGEKLFSHGLGIHTDPSPEQVRDMRREETLQATAILGLEPAEVRFLDYADRSLSGCEAEVAACLVPLLRDVAPAEVLCTGPQEGHPDHRAASAIVRLACAQAAPQAAIRWYITTLAAGTDPSSLAGARRIAIGAQLARKSRAVARFRAHLEIISPRQTAPIVAGFAQYLVDHEILIDA